jgi:hypothetical protein
MVGSPDRPFKRIKRVKGQIREFDTFREMIFNRVKQIYGGDNKKNLFENPVIVLTKDEIPTMESFEKYFDTCLLCGSCLKKVCYESMKGDSTNNDLLFTCDKCFCTTRDSTKEARDFVKWFSNVLKRFSIESFDKMPDYIAAEGDDHFYEWVSSEFTGDYKIKVIGHNKKERIVDK